LQSCFQFESEVLLPDAQPNEPQLFSQCGVYERQEATRLHLVEAETFEVRIFFGHVRVMSQRFQRRYPQEDMTYF
jgi:hypothetical protein